MKRRIFSVMYFLTRLPGTFLVTLVVVLTALCVNRENIDDRWWLPCMFGFVMTFAGNIYLMFVQLSTLGMATKVGKYIGLIVIGVMSVFLGILIYEKSGKISEFPGDDAVQWAFVQSMAGVLGWAWFSLFWNMTAFRYLKPVKAIEVPNHEGIVEYW